MSNEENIKFVLSLFWENKCRVEQLQRLAYEKAKKENSPILRTFKEYATYWYSEMLADLVETLRTVGLIDVVYFRKGNRTVIRYYLTDEGLFFGGEKVGMGRNMEDASSES